MSIKYYDVYYEIWHYDRNGDQEKYVTNTAEDDFNPYDLEDVVQALIEYEKYEETDNLFIMEFTSKRVPISVVDKIKMRLDANKYNL